MRQTDLGESVLFGTTWSLPAGSPSRSGSYDLGEGTFPRVLRFVNGVLEEVGIVSREGWR